MYWPKLEGFLFLNLEKFIFSTYPHLQNNFTKVGYNNRDFSLKMGILSSQVLSQICKDIGHNCKRTPLKKCKCDVVILWKKKKSFLSFFKYTV